MQLQLSVCYGLESDANVMHLEPKIISDYNIPKFRVRKFFSLKEINTCIQ